MVPALARARLKLKRADWAGAWRAATTAGERGRPGAAGHHVAGRRTARRRGAHPAAGLFERLTGRELTILRMLAAPGSLCELAADLFVTPNTMKTHLRTIYRKLDAESRKEAVIGA